MTAVQALIGQDMSLHKSLKYCGVFKRQWYWKPKANVGISRSAGVWPGGLANLIF